MRALLHKMTATTTEPDEGGGAVLKNAVAALAKKALTPISFLHWSSAETTSVIPLLRTQRTELVPKLSGANTAPQSNPRSTQLRHERPAGGHARSPGRIWPFREGPLD